ncbi:hypothetical protein D3C76_1061750 [compost metagenome]
MHPFRHGRPVRRPGGANGTGRRVAQAVPPYRPAQRRRQEFPGYRRRPAHELPRRGLGHHREQWPLPLRHLPPGCAGHPPQLLLGPGLLVPGRRQAVHRSWLHRLQVQRHLQPATGRTLQTVRPGALSAVRLELPHPVLPGVRRQRRHRRQVRLQGCRLEHPGRLLPAHAAQRPALFPRSGAFLRPRRQRHSGHPLAPGQREA